MATMSDPQPYSKVARTTWGDQKFQSLSDGSKFLWFYLLTGPHCTSIPGILPNVGIGTIADALKWTPARVKKQWAEIEAAGMAIADWSANVIVLPNAILYNEPANFNVVTSWRRVPLPQCDLVVRALRAIRITLSSKDDPTPWVDAFDAAFAKAFPEGLSKPFREPFREPLPESGTGTTTGTAKQDQDSGTLTGSRRVEAVEPVDKRPH